MYGALSSIMTSLLRFEEGPAAMNCSAFSTNRDITYVNFNKILARIEQM